MVNVTKRDLAIIGGLAGVADFLAEGRLSAPLSRALKKAAVAVGSRAIFTAPAAARVTAATLPRIGMTALQVGKTIALRHPVLTAGAVVYYTIKNRDEIADLIRQGYDVVEETIPEPTPFASEFAADPFGASAELIQGRGRIPGRILPTIRRKTKTKFNKAVSKGMSVVKASTSYGKKGTINNSKKALLAYSEMVK